MTALVLLKATGSPDKVIQTLGYPSSPMLYHWRKKYPEYYDVPNQKHWRQTPTELKHDVIKRCFIKGEPVKLVAEEIGYTPSLIYKWIREYREKGCFQPMKKTTANINVNPNDITSAKDINELKTQMLDMQMEIDILKETINVLQKDPGIDQTALTNWEKAVIIDAFGTLPIFWGTFSSALWTIQLYILKNTSQGFYVFLGCLSDSAEIIIYLLSNKRIFSKYCFI